jgi:hypothetical protein
MPLSGRASTIWNAVSVRSRCGKTVLRGAPSDNSAARVRRPSRSSSSRQTKLPRTTLCSRIPRACPLSSFLQYLSQMWPVGRFILIAPGRGLSCPSKPIATQTRISVGAGLLDPGTKPRALRILACANVQFLQEPSPKNR